DDGGPRTIDQERTLIAGWADQRPVQPPMSTSFMREGKPVAALACGPLLGIKAFVDDDPAAFKPNGAVDIRVPAATARHAESFMQIVELDAKLEMFLDDVLDRDRRPYVNAPSVGELAKQGLGITLDYIISDVRHLKSHAFLICIMNGRDMFATVQV